jgi:hypothetical protein
MSFKQDHPAYSGYVSDEYHVADLPPSFTAALQGVLIRWCKSETELKNILLDIAGRIPVEPTTNWGWDFLVQEVPYYVKKLRQAGMHKVMDFLADRCQLRNPAFDSDEVNELLEDAGVGYVLERDEFSGKAIWSLRVGVAHRTVAVDAASVHIVGLCGQALEHLTQAREHLRSTESDRDRKDAVRDCLSAVEALLKALSGREDIKNATNALKAAGAWGPDAIIKDGLSLWNIMHDMYPDIRHGQSTTSHITDEEALYWVERISCFIGYLARMERRRRSSS